VRKGACTSSSSSGIRRSGRRGRGGIIAGICGGRGEIMDRILARSGCVCLHGCIKLGGWGRPSFSVLLGRPRQRHPLKRPARLQLRPRLRRRWQRSRLRASPSSPRSASPSSPLRLRRPPPWLLSRETRRKAHALGGASQRPQRAYRRPGPAAGGRCRARLIEAINAICLARSFY
jgi:hypothetical protein